MTSAPRPIDQLTAEWNATRRSPESREALRRLAAAEEGVAGLGCEDLGELVAALGRAEGPAERERAAAVVRAMIRSQDVHPMVARAVLQAILPGLTNVARRLAWGSGGDWEGGGAFLVDVIATAWEVIVDWSGQDRAYAVLDLLSAVRCRLRRQVLGQRDRRRRLVTGIDPESPALVARTSGPSELAQLARAIDELGSGTVEPLDRAVLYASSVLGFTVTELARMSGTTRRQVGRRRERAARELLA